MSGAGPRAPNSTGRCRGIRCACGIRRSTRRGSIRARSRRSGSKRPTSNRPTAPWLEREPSGRLSGLVVGMDNGSRERLPRVTAAELESRTRIYSRELAAAGVTAFTDATVRNGPDDVAHVGAHARERRDWPARRRDDRRPACRRDQSIAADRGAGRDTSGWRQVHGLGHMGSAGRSRAG